MYGTIQTNTWQALVITDGNTSYAVFTYRCGDLEWSDNAVIGFNAGGSIYQNSTIIGKTSACQNSPESVWTNLLYKISSESVDVVAHDQPVEPRKPLLCNTYTGMTQTGCQHDGAKSSCCPL